MTPLAAAATAQALAWARGYLLGRQCANGGFSFYRDEHLEEPSLHDTWHALAALALLDERAPRREDLIHFIAGEPVVAQPYALYFRVRSLALLGHPDPQHAAVAAAAAALKTTLPVPGNAGDLIAHYHQRLYLLRLILWLKRNFGLAYPALDLSQAILASRNDDGGFGLPSNLLATYQVLAILALCDSPLPADAGEFVAGLAAPGFGFRLTVDSIAPSLETTCAGISCCRRLGLPIRYASDALAFLLACQTSSGGFARMPEALPDILLSHLALAGITALAVPLRS